MYIAVAQRSTVASVRLQIRLRVETNEKYIDAAEILAPKYGLRPAILGAQRSTDSKWRCSASTLPQRVRVTRDETHHLSPTYQKAVGRPKRELSRSAVELGIDGEVAEKNRGHVTCGGRQWRTGHLPC